MRAPPDPVSIDGSLLEGGGQILRNAAALAAILGRSIHVSNIRAGREKPGLSAQHLTGLRLVADISGGQLEGGAIRSTVISFTPGPLPPRAGDFTADTQTAGSCTLMTQQALPVLLFAGPSSSSSSSSTSQPPGASCLTLKGGTDAPFAPPVGYLQHVLLPTLQRLLGPCGPGLALNLVRRGFYPKGGGEVQLLVPPLPPGGALPAWRLTQRGHLVRVTGFCVTAGKMRPDIGQRMAAAVRQALREVLGDPDVLFGRGEGGGGGGSGDAAVAAAGAAGAADDDGLRHKAGEKQQHEQLQEAHQDQQRGQQQQQQDSHHQLQQQPQPQPWSQQQPEQHNPGPSPSTLGGRDPRSIPTPVLDIQAVHEPPERAVAEGGSVVLVAQTSSGALLGASALAQRGVTAEAVGAMAARDLVEELRSGAAVDSWMQDQLVVFMALAAGRSAMLCTEPTLHTRTAISIAQQVCPGARFSIRTVLPPEASSASRQDGPGPLHLVECAGAGVAAAASGGGVC